MGGVEVRRDSSELATAAAGLVRELGKETPEVAAKIIGAVRELRERVEPSALPRALELIGELHNALAHDIPSYDEYAARFDVLVDLVIEKLEKERQPETPEPVH